MTNRILTFPELRARGVTIGRRQLDRLEAVGRFPSRVQISPGRVGWLADEVDAHVDGIIARRPARIITNDQSGERAAS